MWGWGRWGGDGLEKYQKVKLVTLGKYWMKGVREKGETVFFFEIKNPGSDRA